MYSRPAVLPAGTLQPCSRSPCTVLRAVYQEREIEGVKYYTFTFKQGDAKLGAREVYQLCISKGRLWSVTATTAEKRWAKRKELFDNVMLSFRPRL